MNTGQDAGEQLKEDDPSFFGPNTFQTTIALGSCIFFLLLTTQHDEAPGTETRRYIEELTGNVIFDLIDVADIIDVFFDEETRSEMWDGLEEVVFFVMTVNLLLPALPLFTLSYTKFGRSRLENHLVQWHGLLLVLFVNVPNLVVRLILWHAFSHGISPFILKNFMLICLTAYEFYEHKRESVKSTEHDGESRRAEGGPKPPRNKVQNINIPLEGQSSEDVTRRAVARS